MAVTWNEDYGYLNPPYLRSKAKSKHEQLQQSKQTNKKSRPKNTTPRFEKYSCPWASISMYWSIGLKTIGVWGQRLDVHLVSRLIKARQVQWEGWSARLGVAGRGQIIRTSRPPGENSPQMETSGMIRDIRQKCPVVIGGQWSRYRSRFCRAAGMDEPPEPRGWQVCAPGTRTPRMKLRISL